MDLGALVGVVLGAILAMAAGIATELWKQRRAHRALARVLWFDLLRNWAVLFGAVAYERWPEPLRMYTQSWHTLGEKLALGSDVQDLLQLQGVFGALDDLQASDARPEPGVLGGLLATVEKALLGLAAEAGFRRDQAPIGFLDRPLIERVHAARLVKEQFPELPDDIKAALADPDEAAAAVERLPEELREALEVLQGQPGHTPHG